MNGVFLFSFLLSIIFSFFLHLFFFFPFILVLSPLSLISCLFFRISFLFFFLFLLIYSFPSSLLSSTLYFFSFSPFSLAYFSSLKKSFFTSFFSFVVINSILMELSAVEPHYPNRPRLTKYVKLGQKPG